MDGIERLWAKVRQGYNALVMSPEEYAELVNSKSRVETAEQEARSARDRETLAYEREELALRKADEALSASADAFSIALSGKLGVRDAQGIPEGFIKGLNKTLARERARLLKENAEVRARGSDLACEASDAIARSESEIAKARTEAKEFVYGHVSQIVAESLGAVSKRYAEIPLAVRHEDEIVYGLERMERYGIAENDLVRIAKSDGARPLEFKIGLANEKEHFDVCVTRLGSNDEEFDLIYVKPEKLGEKARRSYERFEGTFEKVVSSFLRKIDFV